MFSRLVLGRKAETESCLPQDHTRAIRTRMAVDECCVVSTGKNKGHGSQPEWTRGATVRASNQIMTSMDRHASTYSKSKVPKALFKVSLITWAVASYSDY